MRLQLVPPLLWLCKVKRGWIRKVGHSGRSHAVGACVVACLNRSFRSKIAAHFAFLEDGPYAARRSSRFPAVHMAGFHSTDARAHRANLPRCSSLQWCTEAVHGHGVHSFDRNVRATWCPRRMHQAIRRYFRIRGWPAAQCWSNC